MRRRKMIKRAGRSNYVSASRGLDLLDEAIEQIELHAAAGAKGQWDQASYRCGSGMCLAGWAAQLAGGHWADPAGEDYEDYMIADGLDDPRDVSSHYEHPERKMIQVGFRAARLLGMTKPQSYRFFAADNDLADIKRLRNAFARGEKL